MKLILKTLKQVPHEVEIDSDEILIKQLKEATEKKYSIEADSIKLVFNGIVLKDENTIKSYNITEGNVIVMMVSKTKVHNKPKVEEVQSTLVNPNTNVKTDPQGGKEKETTTQSTNKDNTTTSNNQTNTTVNNNVSSSNVQGGQSQVKNYTEEIKALVEMGFPQNYAESAIKVAKGNVSLAIEFLYNGIPESIPTENTSSSNNQGSVNQGTGQQEPTSSLDAVKRIASIIKVICNNNPSALQGIMLSLQQTRPELIELIKQHEEEFKTILQSPVTNEDLNNFQQYNMEFSQEGGQFGSQGGESSTTGRQEGQEVIRLSKEEFDAIQKLKEFGFSEMDAAQAYFACDKNAEMALNFLFEMKTQEGGSFDSKLLFIINFQL